MADQISVEGQPLVVAPTDAPETAAVHPPTDSYGPGSAEESAGSGTGDITTLPGGAPAISGTGDRPGPDPLAARG